MFTAILTLRNIVPHVTLTVSLGDLCTVLRRFEEPWSDKTLMDRAKYHLSTSERKRSKKQQVISDLKFNGYVESFIERCPDSAQVTNSPKIKKIK